MQANSFVFMVLVFVTYRKMTWQVHRQALIPVGGCVSFVENRREMYVFLLRLEGDGEI